MWVLRGMKSIFGYDPDTHQIAWEITDINKGVVHANHEMAYAGGLVTTSVFFGREEKRGGGCPQGTSISRRFADR